MKTPRKPRIAVTAIVALAAVVASVVTVQTANASPARVTAVASLAESGWKLVSNSDFTSQALTCNAGDICVWPVIDGSKDRCSWTNQDNDWWNAPTVCSWASTRPAMAIYNHGASSTFAGVCVYRGANYTDVAVFVPQGLTATNEFGEILRSHKWVRPGVAC